jgi:hypothetical protein
MRILISVQNIQARTAKIFVLSMKYIMSEGRPVHSLSFLFVHVLFAR